MAMFRSVILTAKALQLLLCKSVIFYTSPLPDVTRMSEQSKPT